MGVTEAGRRFLATSGVKRTRKRTIQKRSLAAIRHEYYAAAACGGTASEERAELLWGVDSLRCRRRLKPLECELSEGTQRRHEAEFGGVRAEVGG
eukprot:scaffold232859_cov36-Tisochrysis_lutea.AAC.2